MVAERKSQIRADETYPSKMGYAHIMNTLPGQWGERRSAVSYVQDTSKRQGMTNKAFLTMWAEKYVSQRAYLDVIWHLRGVGQITHELAKLDARVAPNANFEAYARLDCFVRTTAYPALVPYDDCDTVVAMRNRIDPDGADWGPSMCLVG